MSSKIPYTLTASSSEPCIDRRLITVVVCTPFDRIKVNSFCPLGRKSTERSSNRTAVFEHFGQRSIYLSRVNRLEIYSCAAHIICLTMISWAGLMIKINKKNVWPTLMTIPLLLLLCLSHKDADRIIFRAARM